MRRVAGLWECLRPQPDAAPVETFALLTTTPNAVAAPIHDRMPVILDDQGARTWLDGEATPETLLALLRPAPDDALTAYRVSASVGSPRNAGPECVAPVD